MSFNLRNAIIKLTHNFVWNLFSVLLISFLFALSRLQNVAQLRRDLIFYLTHFERGLLTMARRAHHHDYWNDFQFLLRFGKNTTTAFTDVIIIITVFTDLHHWASSLFRLTLVALVDIGSSDLVYRFFWGLFHELRLGFSVLRLVLKGSQVMCLINGLFINYLLIVPVEVLQIVFGHFHSWALVFWSWSFRANLIGRFNFSRLLLHILRIFIDFATSFWT
jgi:hypothetical protein